MRPSRSRCAYFLIDGSPARGDLEPEAQRGVHGHRDRHHRRVRQLLRVDRLDRGVHQRGPVAGALEEGGGPRHGQRLVAELVAGHEEDVARLAHTAQSTLPAARPSMRQNTVTAAMVASMSPEANSKGMAGSPVMSRRAPAMVCETAMPR